MIKQLTKKEAEFLQQLASLLKNYDAAILCDESVPNTISFEVYDGHEHPLPILLGAWVDEEDIYSLFRCTYEELKLSQQVEERV